MARAFTIGSPPLEITLRRSDRAKRFSLRIGRAEGQVVLSLPKWAPEAEAMRFVASQEGWIRQTLAKHPPRQGLAVGGVIPFAGQMLRIELGKVRSVRLEPGVIRVPEVAGAAPGARLEAFLRLAARQRLQAACVRYAAMVGKDPCGITLRDTRSRWGSCSSAGMLMFSWRLIMAPPEVLDYVAAHEVAHLAEMNHSAAFWAVVRRLMPDFQAHRDWLRRHGADLHAVRFRAPGD